jgi:ABC-type dipeptide/oligopeptide/nickel transport system permease component
VLGAVVVIATGFVVINFTVDVFYSLIDPRVRRDG